MMFCDTQSYGQRSNHCLQTSLKRSALSVISRNQGCSERVKTAVRQHSQPSGVTPGRNYESIMTNVCTKHQAKGS